MSTEVPEGWSIHRIGDLGLVDCGKAKNPRQKDPERPYLRVANVLDGRIDASDVLTMPFSDAEYARYRVEPGDILLNEGQSLDLVGRPAVYRGEPPNVAIQNALLRWRPDPDSVDAEFAYQVIRKLYRDGVFSTVATQTTSIAHLGLKRFASIRVQFPPLPEQEKIAAILSAVDAAIEATRALVEQTRRVKAGLLQDLLTRGIGPDGEPHTDFRKTAVGAAPTAWSTQPIGQLLESCTYGVSVPLSDQPSGVPVLRMGNLQDGRLDLSDLRYADLSDFDAEAVNLQAGDILFNRTNSWDLVGKVAMVGSDSGPLSYASYLLRLRTRPERASPEWLCASLGSDHFQWRLRSLATKGVSQVNINPTAFRRLRLAVPPLDEQQRIVERFQSSDRVIDAHNLRLKSLQQLKAGLLQDLLTGKTRVTP